MSLRYSGPAVLRADCGVFTVQAELFTNHSDGVYHWGGRISCSDVAALRSRGQGCTLTLPEHGDAEVHVAVAELDVDNGGVLLRITGAGRAPYEQDGDIPTCGARTVFWPDDEACDAECALPQGHEPNEIHCDDILGEWNEDDLSTTGGREWGYRYPDWEDSISECSRWYAQEKANEDLAVTVVHRDGDGPWVDAF